MGSIDLLYSVTPTGTPQSLTTSYGGEGEWARCSECRLYLAGIVLRLYLQRLLITVVVLKRLHDKFGCLKFVSR